VQAEAYLACAKGLQSREAAQTLTGAQLAAEAGYLLLAAETASQAVRFFARDGNQRMARQAGKLLQELLKALPAAAAAQLTGIPSRRDLTFRERDVAVLAASGVRSREIAQRLGVSVRTVEGHIYRIYEKLDVRSRGELAARINEAKADDAAGV
jgi:DNA-binding NarL/FixJ family response regulator